VIRSLSNPRGFLLSRLGVYAFFASPIPGHYVQNVTSFTKPEVYSEASEGLSHGYM